MKISGHSLGAGVASIAGVWAALQWPAADIQVVTFGSPMPGNAMFAEVRKFEPALAAATYVTQSVCTADAAPCAAACNAKRDPGWRHPRAAFSHGFCYILAILIHKGLSIRCQFGAAVQAAGGAAESGRALVGHRARAAAARQLRPCGLRCAFPALQPLAGSSAHAA